MHVYVKALTAGRVLNHHYVHFLLDWKDSLLGASTNATPVLTVHPPDVLKLSTQPPTDPVVGPSINVARLPNGDLVAAKCKQKIWEFCREHEQTELYPNLGIVAGFLLCQDNDMKKSVVIAVGSGCKCLGSPVADADGQMLHDLHAVAIARRALLKFLYQQVENAYSNSDNIFVVTDNKLQLHNSLSLHLYISSVPCGDACILEAVNPATGENSLLLPDTKHSKFQLKEGDSLETVATDTYAANGVEDSNGNVKCMSCSDKIALWNVAGIQGALLSYFMHPIYVQSITVGSRAMSTDDHLQRAFFSRIGELDGLPSMFKICRPRIFIPVKYLEDYQTKMPTDPYAISTNWYCGAGIELVDPVLGKCESTHPSRLSKSNLYHEYVKLKGWVKSSDGNTPQDSTYYHAKQNAHDYQHVKHVFREIMEERGCGHWLKKPKELELFT